MIYDVFIYTRDHDCDYNWKIKPEYIPADFSKIIQSLIDINREVLFMPNDWFRIVFFMKIKNVNIAMRFLRNGEDYVGRPIWSIEGISALDIGKRAVLGMPDIVKYLYGLPYGFAEMNKRNDLPEEIEIVDYINPLLGYAEYENDDNIKKVMLNNSEFMKMIADCKYSNVNFNCIVGENSGKILPYLKTISNICHFYDFNKKHKIEGYEAGMEDEIDIINKEDVIFTENEENRRKLKIRFIKGFGLGSDCYEWLIEDSKTNIILGRNKRKFSDKIGVEKLVSEREKIEAFYYLTGDFEKEV